MTGAPDRVATGKVLHLNLNTRDIQAASGFYVDAFGLDLRMQSQSDDGDWSFHGITEPVSSAGWFLYDDRGPRKSPALELVEWRSPATRGASYETLLHLGMASVSLSVPSIDSTLRQVRVGGGTVVGDLSSRGDGTGVLVRDRDGVFVEARERPGPARIAAARLGVSDLDASLAWYEMLGFGITQAPREDELLVAGVAHRIRLARVALSGHEVELVLTQWLDGAAAPEPPHARLWTQGMVRMAVSVDDLDDAMAALAARGLELPAKQVFAMPGTRIGALPVLFLTDPDGFTVELVHRPPRHFTERTQDVSGQARA